jgi:hypothetical protein
MPKDPPPNPSTPPNGIYTSTCGADFSSWGGSFVKGHGSIRFLLTQRGGIGSGLILCPRRAVGDFVGSTRLDRLVLVEAKHE